MKQLAINILDLKIMLLKLIKDLDHSQSRVISLLGGNIWARLKPIVSLLFLSGTPEFSYNLLQLCQVILQEYYLTNQTKFCFQFFHFKVFFFAERAPFFLLPGQKHISLDMTDLRPNILHMLKYNRGIKSLQPWKSTTLLKVIESALNPL